MENYLPLDTPVPFILATYLNKCGYRNPTHSYYNIYNKFLFNCECELHNEAIWAPTYGEAIKWFKDTHNIIVEPTEVSLYVALSKLDLTV